MKRLAVITTHQIQYNAPFFKLLSERNNIELKVFYTWSQSANGNLYDPGFGLERKWDIPLLVGYDYEFVINTSREPGSHHYNGIINPNLISTIEKYNPSAILVYGWNFQSHLKVMRHFKGKISIWFRGDSTLLGEQPGFSIKKIIRRISLKWVYRYVDIALYVGSANRKYFLTHGLSKKQLEFVPHVIDNTRFAEPNDIYQTEAAYWREQLGISINHIVFLFAGKFEKIKNPELLVKAFSSIENKSVHLLLVGNGKLEVSLKKNCSKIRNIHFIGFQNQARMPILYRLADVFILPSISETWGLSINEAMASSCAILASDMCGAAVDLVENGINGFVFKSGNEEDLILKLKAFIENSAFLHKMKINSFEKIKTATQESNANIIEKLLLSY